MATVLVIENDVPAMRLLGWGLMEEGFEVAVAHVDEAPGHLASKRPDLLVFNTLRRNDEKARLVSEFRALSPATKFVDLSAASDGETTPAFADAHLTLPITIGELVKTLHELSA